jgi:D-threo-aldose 1-dehydrogenase
VPDEQAVAIVHAAFHLGVRCFDTAPFYGVGKSERRWAPPGDLPRDRVAVSTKVGPIL